MQCSVVRYRRVVQLKRGFAYGDTKLEAVSRKRGDEVLRRCKDLRVDRIGESRQPFVTLQPITFTSLQLCRTFMPSSV